MANANCPGCGVQLRAPDTSGLYTLRCPACGVSFRVRIGHAPPEAVEQDESDWLTKLVVAATVLAALGIGWLFLFRVLDKPDADGPVSASAVEPAASQPREQGRHPATDAPPATAPKPSELSPEEVFARVSPAVVRIVARDRDFKPIGQGSGFFVSADGLLVTNHHVIAGAEFATVLLPDNSTLFVDGFLAQDRVSDLALLKVNGRGLTYVTVRAGPLPRVGAQVYAIGNPKGLTNTFAAGLVSGHRAWEGGLLLLQTSAPISKGSSGGPLVAANGEVVGVTTFYLAGGQNLNFVVPSERVQQLIARQGPVQRIASAGGTPLGKAATDHLSKVWDAMEREDWGTAVRMLTGLKKTHKSNPFVWYALGYLHVELGNYAAAIAAYKAVLTIKPDYVAAYNDMGVAYMRLGENDKALAACRAAVAIKPDFAQAHFNIAKVCGKLGRHAAVINALKKVIEIQPDNVDAYVGAAASYNVMGRYTEALAACKKAIAIQPNNAQAYHFACLAYGSMGRDTEAIAAYRKTVAIKPDNAEAHYFAGFLYTRMERPSDALAAYKKAIAIKPEYADAYQGMGITYKAMGLYADAIAAFKKAIALNPGNAEIYADMGDAYFLSDRYAESMVMYERAVAVKPNLAKAQVVLGLLYENAGRKLDALKSYDAAIRADPVGESGKLARTRRSAILGR